MPLGFLHVLFLFHQAQHSKFAHGNTGSEKGLKSLVTKTSPPAWTLDFLGKRNATRISLTALLTYWSVLMAALYKFAYQHSIVAVRWAHEARSWRGRWKWIEPYVLVALEPHSTQSRNGSLKGFGRDKNPAKSSFFLRGLTSFPPHFRHLARAAALIRASPAGEMRRLPALIGTTFWPLAFAQRAF